MALGGEGLETVLLLVTLAVLFIIIVVAWNILKKKRSLYTYKYSQN